MNSSQRRCSTSGACDADHPDHHRPDRQHRALIPNSVALIAAERSAGAVPDDGGPAARASCLRLYDLSSCAPSPLRWRCAGARSCWSGWPAGFRNPGRGQAGQHVGMTEGGGFFTVATGADLQRFRRPSAGCHHRRTENRRRRRRRQGRDRRPLPTDAGVPESTTAQSIRTAGATGDVGHLNDEATCSPTAAARTW